MKQNKQGFSLFVALIAVTLITIVGVVGFVALKKPVTVTGLPSKYVPPVAEATMQPSALPSTAPVATPAPTISASTDDKVIEKELNDTKVDSVDADFSTMNTSASSL